MNSYALLQKMIINELLFLNDNVNYATNKIFSKNQVNGELHKLLTLLLNYKKLNKNLLNINYDIKNLLFLLENKDKIDIIYFDDVKGYVQSAIVNLFESHKRSLNNYPTELDVLLKDGNENLIPTITDIDVNKFSHIQLARLLCYTAVIESRNSKPWRSIFLNETNANTVIESFLNYIIHVLNMIKSNQTSLNNSVSIVYHTINVELNLQNKLKPRNINIEIVDKDKFENRQTDIEVCYVLNNNLHAQDAASQQTFMYASFVELNVLPFCLFNETLPNEQSISVFGLYRFEQTKNKTASKPSRLGNVMFVNSLTDKPITRETIINTINSYHNACQNLKKLGHRVVGDYRVYEANYKLAALDFIILILVTSITHQTLKYNMLNVYEKMFQDLKATVCKHNASKLYNILINYDINKEPLSNFQQNYEVL
ncbi:hypothetical protein [Thysanoplusia orichalcea nucleopolyhedrovirus]|uniref:Uncharacterized protein n=1 Tax=Thysanoplusia orichalcea nucleopolyhedrovirus TaxID=101850 RepID=L0CLE9_9ABAC|nr:hypothetical protein [Thysanoplusia orichalcea nucleopolyhedrovirus]AGA16265.1 hypothetical protein [Thysanoplusia orichalcea nucleopolyhedrovirus]